MFHNAVSQHSVTRCPTHCDRQQTIRKASDYSRAIKQYNQFVALQIAGSTVREVAVLRASSRGGDHWNVQGIYLNRLAPELFF